MVTNLHDLEIRVNVVSSFLRIHFFHELKYTGVKTNGTVQNITNVQVCATVKLVFPSTKQLVSNFESSLLCHKEPYFDFQTLIILNSTRKRPVVTVSEHELKFSAISSSSRFKFSASTELASVSSKKIWVLLKKFTVRGFEFSFLNKFTSF